MALPLPLHRSSRLTRSAPAGMLQVHSLSEGVQVAAGVFHLLLAIALIGCHAETDLAEAWLPVSCMG
jgi:hypothetical protein